MELEKLSVLKNYNEQNNEDNTYPMEKTNLYIHVRKKRLIHRKYLIEEWLFKK